MPVIVDDDEIETFPANRADQALDVGILPGRSWSGQHFFHPEGCNPATEPRSIDAVPVPQKIARGLAPWECFDDLLPSPLACGVLGDVDMDHLRRSKRSTTSTYRIWKVTVGTMKKSMQARSGA